MAKYLQIRRFKLYCSAKQLHTVIAKCIENDVTEFTVSDDRGGNGGYAIFFPPETSKAELRRMFGKDVELLEE